MKITQGDEKEFKPITIVLETEKEAALIELIFSYPSTISEVIDESGNGLSKSKIEDAMDSIDLSNALSKMGLDNNNWEKHFGK